MRKSLIKIGVGAILLTTAVILNKKIESSSKNIITHIPEGYTLQWKEFNMENFSEDEIKDMIEVFAANTLHTENLVTNAIMYKNDVTEFT